MPRPEKSLDGSAGPLPRFAEDLRALRRNVPGLTYRVMAKKVNYSPSVLSGAAAGEKLPTLEVTRAYVAACGGDCAEWSARWRSIAEELDPTGAAAGYGPAPREAAPDVSAPNPVDDANAAAFRGGRRRNSLVVLAIAVLALSATVAVLTVIISQSTGNAASGKTISKQGPVPRGVPATGEPSPKAPCSELDGARACFDKKRGVFWVKDLARDHKHTAISWQSTHGMHGSCHNYRSSDGPWVTCQQPRALARDGVSVTFRAEKLDGKRIRATGKAVVVPLG